MSELLITNTLTGKKTPFTPMVPGEVSIYLCGPTVYGLTHIGNARPAIFFDFVWRFFDFLGYKTKFVSNYTDVDDKIINRAREEKTPWKDIAEKYIYEYRIDMKALGLRTPDVTPKVTDHIEAIIRFIEKLIDNKAAYVTDEGEVLYSVRSFAEYGKLSGKKIDDLLSGARVEPGEKKKDPLDFALWKPQKAEDEPAWESPWGKGRPGWHIECSVMSVEHLGETFDIHGGGMDLIHPHHENEIAQSEAATGKEYARCWMHNNMLTISNEKMSKSIGNIISNREFIQRHTGEVLKFLILSGHYRSTIDFSEKTIRDTQAALHRFYSCARKCEAFLQNSTDKETPSTKTENELFKMGESLIDRMKETLLDDFNTAKFFGQVFEYVRSLNGYMDGKGFKLNKHTLKIANTFLENRKVFSQVLNVFGEEPATFLDKLRGVVLEDRGLKAAEIEAQIAARIAARSEKDFAKADGIRDSLLQQGILVMDSPTGTVWDITFSQGAENE